MGLVKIDDLNAPELAVYTRLTEAQRRNRLNPAEGVFLAESPKVIRVALAQGYTPLSLLTEERHLALDAAELLPLLGDIPIYTGERELLATLTGYTLTRGVLCAMRRPRPTAPETVIAGARRLAVLEGVVDATNIGAIFRSAAALGMDGVLLTESCCDPYNRRALRVSMGTVCQIPWAVTGDWAALLREAGFRTCALALEERSLPLDDPRLKAEPKLALVLGAEGDGLAKSTIAQCDYTVKIPMFHGVDSLNVAAASAVAFWELR